MDMSQAPDASASIMLLTTPVVCLPLLVLLQSSVMWPIGTRPTVPFNYVGADGNLGLLDQASTQSGSLNAVLVHIGHDQKTFADAQPVLISLSSGNRVALHNSG